MIKISLPQKLKSITFLTRFGLALVIGLLFIYLVTIFSIPVFQEQDTKVTRGGYDHERVVVNLVMYDTSMPEEFQYIGNLVSSSDQLNYPGPFVGFNLRNINSFGVLPYLNIQTKLCLTELHILNLGDKIPFLPEQVTSPDNPFNAVGNEIVFELPNTIGCTNNIIGITFPDTVLGSIPYSDTVRSYYYPFDRRSLDVAIWLEAIYTNADGIEEELVIAPDLNINLSYLEWARSLSVVSEYSAEQGHNITRFSLDLNRPLFYPFLTIVLLGLTFTFIAYLIFIRDNNILVGMAIAVLLGIWGIRTALVPDDMDTIIDPIILILYAFLGFVVFVRLIVIRLWNSSSYKSQDNCN